MTNDPQVLKGPRAGRSSMLFRHFLVSISSADNTRDISKGNEEATPSWRKDSIQGHNVDPTACAPLITHPQVEEFMKNGFIDESSMPHSSRRK